MSSNSKKGQILSRVKDPDWFRHSNGESLKSVGRRAEPAVMSRPNSRLGERGGRDTGLRLFNMFF